MNSYLVVAADPSAVSALDTAIRSCGGKPINPTCYIISSNDSADHIHRRLRPTVPGGLVVCSLDTDWSF